ncbi:MAG: hypothetical protein L3J79_09450 [Candidatus Marinimicrobia bacterium]|nr:hypothetical protein [Candidatus Neomarinimicrobiota bacterium]
MINKNIKEREAIMKKFNSLFLGISMLALMADPVLAVDTTKTYSSGLLVGAFLAFCALIVVAQLMPTLIILASFIKGLINGTEKQKAHLGTRR